MTLLLASVTGPDEAQIALTHGADIIDLKDVSQSALAGLPLADVRATLAAVAGRRPVSAVAGNVTMTTDTIAAAVAALGDAGVDYIKVALEPHSADRAHILKPLAQRFRLIGVMFADQDPDSALVPLVAECGFAGIMLDTAQKGSGRLLEHMDIAALSRFVAASRATGLTVGLAGSLEPPDIPRLLLLAPDVLGFRGALCVGGDRTSGIQPTAVDVVRELIPNAQTARPAAGRLARLEPHMPTPPRHEAEPTGQAATDRIFVHDLVLPVRIGAYAQEHTRAQNVRFNVDVWVVRPERAADIRDVLSYDLITDGIKIITARDHIDLVEDLAERIADFVLAFPRVVGTTVRIEKPDIGPGTVGVEISRRRPADIAKVHHLFPAALGGAWAAE